MEDTIALMASCKHHAACQRLVMLYAPFDENAYIWCMCRACPHNKPQEDESENATNVLRDIDQLRRDLAKYHDVLKAYDNLQRHCDNQRKELASLGAAHVPIKGERDAYRKQCDKLAAENAKLRELAAGIGHLLFILDVDYCAACPRDDINHPCPVHTVEGGECLYETDLRDLGVEVD